MDTMDKKAVCAQIVDRLLGYITENPQLYITPYWQQMEPQVIREFVQSGVDASIYKSAGCKFNFVRGKIHSLPRECLTAWHSVIDRELRSINYPYEEEINLLSNSAEAREKVRVEIQKEVFVDNVAGIAIRLLDKAQYKPTRGFRNKISKALVAANFDFDESASTASIKTEAVEQLLEKINEKVHPDVLQLLNECGLLTEERAQSIFQSIHGCTIEAFEGYLRQIAGDPAPMIQDKCGIPEEGLPTRQISLPANVLERALDANGSQQKRRRHVPAADDFDADRTGWNRVQYPTGLSR